MYGDSGNNDTFMYKTLSMLWKRHTKKNGRLIDKIRKIDIHFGQRDGENLQKFRSQAKITSIFS